MDNKHKLWVEKYRPQDVDTYIFHDAQQRAAFMRMINEKTIPHLLLSGVQGSGKTTIARILINAMQLDDSDVLTINASRENSVDTVRDKIQNFVSTFAMSAFKIVHLEEADFISLAGQAVMRDIMEKYADHVRFILTCNYVNKIMPAIASRCQSFYFKAADREEIRVYCATILVNEHVKAKIDILDKYIAYGYPDIRKIVNSLQQNSVDGKLQDPKQEGSAGDWKFGLLDLIEHDKWVEARKLVCEHVNGEEWVELYRFLYENLSSSSKFKQQDKWDEAIVMIATHLYQHGIVADPEINAAALFIELGRL